MPVEAISTPALDKFDYDSVRYDARCVSPAVAVRPYRSREMFDTMRKFRTS